QDSERRVRLDRVGDLERRRQRRAKLPDPPLDRVEVVKVERRPEALGGEPDRVRELSAVDQRSAPSSAVLASVRVSRYFTMIGADSESPRDSAHAPDARRLPGTTTAP